MVLLSLTPAAAARAADADAGAVEAGASAPDGGAADSDASPAADGGAPVDSAPPPALAPVVPPPPDPSPIVVDDAPKQVEPLTVVGTRESRTAGSVQVLRPQDLERMDYDNPETILKQVPGVYTRGEDGFGLRPNIGIRGTSPDRSKKVTLMEDGILFGPAPYSAPAAYYFPLMTQMELIRVIKGPGAVSYGPQTVGGAIDFVTRPIPATESGAIDVSAGTFGYGKVDGFYGTSTARSGYVLEGVFLRTSGFKKIDGGGSDTGFEKGELVWKGRYLLSTDPNASQQIGLKLGYADEDSRESYLGLTDADLRANPNRRYRASLLDRMQWHRTQIVASYHGKFGGAFTVDVAAYRHDFHRTWRKVNRIGRFDIARVLAEPTTGTNAILYSVLTGASDSSSSDEIIYIGPNQRSFVAQGVQVVAGWRGASGPVTHRVEAGARFHYDRIDRLHTEDGFLMVGGNLVPTLDATITNANNRAWANALALYLTDAATWSRLTFTPGVRVELIHTAVRDRRAATEVTGAPQRVVIPGLGVYGALTPSLGLLAGVYHGFSPAAPGQPAAVKPESSTNYEAGVRFTPPRTRLEAIGFFNDYQNLTATCTIATCGPTMEGLQTDAGRAHIYGAEFFGRSEPIVGKGYVIPLMFAYTYTRTKLLQVFDSEDPTLRDAQVGDELPFVPRHQASATAAFETPYASLAAAGTYVSEMREHVGPPGQPSAPREPLTDPSFILDATARVRVTAAGQVYVSVRNLLGADDIAARLPFGARPVAPRWIQVGTQWSF
jgi:Fe(3+) dicitrate transport protein